MKNCAIVCEYNPFHTGHKYQLDCVRKRGIDNIFCVISGSFVQSAMPAFCDKSIRAECAVLGGADAVIELPTVYSTASAQDFAEGAVKIIAGIKNISHIAMGAIAQPDDILRIAEIKTEYSDRYTAELKCQLNSGKSYNAACVAALSKMHETIFPDRNSIDGILADPNNMLCIEYITAIKKYAANIEPIIIKRLGAKYNDYDTAGIHISATAIRNAYSNGCSEDIEKYIPFKYKEMYEYRISHAPDLTSYKNIAVYSLKSADINYISNLRNCSEGLEYLLKSKSFYDFDSYIEAATSRRYSKKRLFRLFLDIILGIDKDYMSKRFCTRLLACKNAFDFTLLPSCVKSTNADIKNAAANDSEIRQVLQIDEKAVALYNTISKLDGDYYNYSLIKI
ncbi:MAG: nucleotidyltransferase family protein [Clostridiales bacterium]|nr:nucleotidyltransferase family protein [Clostridiales bacterium]